MVLSLIALRQVRVGQRMTEPAQTALHITGRLRTCLMPDPMPDPTFQRSTIVLVTLAL